MHRSFIVAAGAFAALALLLGACGDDDSGAAATTTGPQPAGTLPATVTTSASPSSSASASSTTATTATTAAATATTPAATATTPAAATVGPATVTAVDTKFDTDTIVAKAGTQVKVTLVNNGTALHNIDFYDKKGGAQLDPASAGALLKAGATEDVTFPAPAAGTYYFQCDVHPDQMFGTFIVE